MSGSAPPLPLYAFMLCPETTFEHFVPLWEELEPTCIQQSYLCSLQQWDIGECSEEWSSKLKIKILEVSNKHF